MSYTTDNNILAHVTGKQTLEEIPVGELIEITRQYPAFGAAKFLLAKKTQAESHPTGNKYIQSAVLHFPNPHWFHFKMNEELLMGHGMPPSPKTIVAEKAAEVIEEEPVAPAPLPFDLEKAITNLQFQPPSTEDMATANKPDNGEEILPPDQETVIEEEKEQPVEDILPPENIPSEQIAEPVEIQEGEHGISATDQEQPVEDVLTPEKIPAEPVVEPVETSGEEQVPGAADLEQPPENLLLPAHTAEEQPDKPVEVVVEEQIPGNEQVIVEESKQFADDLQQTGQAEDEQPAKTTTEEHESETDALQPADAIGEPATTPVEIGTDEISTTLEEQIIEEEHPAEVIALVGVLPEETDEQREADNTDGFEDADAENEAVMPGMGNAKISSVLDEQLAEFQKPVADGTPVLIESEPYHTIDYFASQGIKLSLELQKQDHLAVKVKKFTDWLKQMKRISPTPADLGIDEATEHKVQDSAAGSNELREVVTEAMAEVFAMQGMTEKAIQVYIKLSFLDPSKTAYFATKIEKLKGI